MGRGVHDQGLLGKVGVTSRYVMVNTFLYSLYGQGGGTKHVKDRQITAYRNLWLDALLLNTSVTAVITLGGLAKTAFGLWVATRPAAAAGLHVASILHPTYPESASVGGQITLAAATARLLADWAAALPGLRAAVTAEQPPDLQPYTDHW